MAKMKTMFDDRWDQLAKDLTDFGQADLGNSERMFRSLLTRVVWRLQHDLDAYIVEDPHGAGIHLESKGMDPHWTDRELRRMEMDKP